MVKTERITFTRWKDPRLALGVLLIAVSAIAGAFLMQGPETKAVYRANSAMVPGTTVEGANFAIVDVPVDLAEGFIGPSDGMDDRRIGQVIEQGQLLSTQILEADPVEAGYTHLVVPLVAPAPASLSQGSSAELWRIKSEQTGGDEASAERIASDLVIVSISSTDSMRIDQYGAEIQVTNSDVPDVLAVLGSSDGLVLAKGSEQ